jgi:hypothetical protein
VNDLKLNRAWDAENFALISKFTLKPIKIF